jgi:ankyrin repeat protein
VAANDASYSATHTSVSVNTSSASISDSYNTNLLGDFTNLPLSQSAIYASSFASQNDIRLSNLNNFMDVYSTHEKILSGMLSMPDFASSLFRVIPHVFPRAVSSPHLVILGNRSALDSALKNVSGPDTLQLIRRQSIDHQIIYMIFHRLINDSDAALALKQPETELDQLFKTGVVQCFSLDKRMLSSLVNSIPPPYKLALVQNIFRAALVLGNGTILDYVLETDQTDLVNQSFLLEGVEYYPLRYACAEEHFQAIRVLLDHGADPNGDLPVFRCLETILGHPWMRRDPAVVVPILQLLIDHGLQIEPAEFSDRMDGIPQSNRDELSVLATHFLQRSFETFFQHGCLTRLLLQTEWDDPSSKTLKAILNQAFLETNGQEGSWNSVLSGSLSAAVLRNRASAVDTLLSMGARPNTHCLISAAQSNDVQVLKDFLSRGLDPNAKAEEPVLYNRRGWNRDHDCTALSVSILNHSKGAFEVLRERGFVSRLSQQPAGLVPAFVAACEVGDSVIVEELLSMPNFPRRETKLRQAIEAAMEGDQDHIIGRLLSAGMKPNAKSLLLAIQRKRLETVILLIRYIHTVQLFVLDTGEQPNVILWEALRWGNQTVIERLLKLGQPVNVCNAMVDVQVRDWDLLPGLPAPCNYGDWKYTPLSAAILTENLSVVKMLLTYGVQAVSFRAHGTSYQCNSLYETVDYASGWILTPLAAATVTNDLPLIKEMLYRGADPFDNSALFVCAMFDSREDVIALLLPVFRTRYPDGAQFFGSDALYRAIRSGNTRVLKLLAKDVDLAGPVQEDRKPDTSPDLGDTVFTSPLGEAIRRHAETGFDAGVLDYLLPLVKDLNAVVHRSYKHGNMTSLLYAISLGSLTTVRKLHQAGADISLPAEWLIDRTPLQAASEFGSKDIAEYLLRKGADADEPPAARTGGTALQLAAIKGNIGIATILLDAGADIDGPPAFCDGRTAFEGATEHGRIEMMIFLVGRGADLLSNENLQYRRAVAFAEDNAQYAARKLADELYAKLLAKQGMSFIDMDADMWTGPNMSTSGGSL